MTRVLIIVVMLAQAVAPDPEQALADAARTYDLNAARAVAGATVESTDAAGALLHAKASLLVAELLRIDFEALPENDAAERRALGQAIDEAAESGLASLSECPEDSETWRIRADLIGTQIRSQYRAGKYKRDLNHAVEEALRLDPKNARAHVSAAKTHLFRPDASEAELREGLGRLDAALALDGSLEQAWLLKAHGLELLGEREGAQSIWRQCLERNPACKPAARGVGQP
jgi:tetratricopeptide (TPR) repeat protein